MNRTLFIIAFRRVSSLSRGGGGPGFVEPFPKPGHAPPTGHIGEVVMIPITLRPYQEKDVERIRNQFARVFRVLYTLATGGGKTYIFCYIAMSAIRRGKRVLILAHRVEILDQISESLNAMGVEHGVVAAGYAGNAELPIQVAKSCH